MLDRNELAAWLRLIETPDIGLATARQLLAAFGSPEAVFDAPPALWARTVGESAARALAKPPDQLGELVERTWDWLHADAPTAPRHLLALGDAGYPKLLLETADPPLMLYAVGRVELLAAPAVAIVGSRNPTPQGTLDAREFGTALSSAGLCVISGLALGIDGAAHEGALDAGAATGGGGTIAVMGTGVDRIYPKRHHALARRIASEGLLLSECALGAMPLAHHFPRRNRLIAGLSLGTLVVEAALQSGSLITARLAAEIGREVFAIPGSIHSPLSRGCHALIRQGAKLVETAQDVLDELRWQPGTVAPAGQTPSLAAPDDPLLAALGHDPLTLDALAGRTGIAPAELSARLLELELAGVVARLPGQRFQRLVRA
ncbi:DNA-processing protein DprA [Rivibacter subsaxonicus]|uniref:DNA protecting protein DprA n=1 Tax=Rivibacter subsaxonicus TaxID=457575 RepID=A0A4Q7VVD5_9BURK|nr:DNA-processing protein DprA [Rivibacter subsaxonicus]RZU00590.1 DNA protecting protein DprA [Rivibacter subsaxonicus]